VAAGGRAGGDVSARATALVVGVGGIGSQVAHLASAFGMTVIGASATAPPPGSPNHRAAALDTLRRAPISVIPRCARPGNPGHEARFRAMRAGLLHQYRRHDSPARSPVAALRAREIAGAVSTSSNGTAAGRPSAVDDARRSDHGNGGSRPLSRRAPVQVLSDSSRRFRAGLRNIVDKSRWF
jgi:hypothetical protein